MKQNRPPTEGRQYFGLGKIDATSRVLTMALHDIEGKLLYQVDIAPQV
jgi:alkaline phosphatase D